MRQENPGAFFSRFRPGMGALDLGLHTLSARGFPVTADLCRSAPQARISLDADQHNIPRYPRHRYDLLCEPGSCHTAENDGQRRFGEATAPKQEKGTCSLGDRGLGVRCRWGRLGFVRHVLHHSIVGPGIFRRQLQPVMRWCPNPLIRALGRCRGTLLRGALGRNVTRRVPRNARVPAGPALYAVTLGPQRSRASPSSSIPRRVRGCWLVETQP
jgi:hypothetical protein